MPVLEETLSELIHSSTGATVPVEETWAHLERLGHKEDGSLRHTALRHMRGVPKHLGTLQSGVALLIASAMLAGAASKKVKVERHHWMPRAYSSRFGWGDGRFPITLNVAGMLLAAHVRTDQMTNRSGTPAAYSPTVEAGLGLLEARFSSAVDKTTGLAKADLATVAAFSVTLDARKPDIVGGQASFVKGGLAHIGPRISQVLEAYGPGMRASLVRPEQPLGFNPFLRAVDSVAGSGFSVTPLTPSTALVLDAGKDVPDDAVRKAVRTEPVSASLLMGLASYAVQGTESW